MANPASYYARRNAQAQAEGYRSYAEKRSAHEATALNTFGAAASQLSPEDREKYNRITNIKDRMGPTSQATLGPQDYADLAEDFPDKGDFWDVIREIYSRKGK